MGNPGPFPFGSIRLECSSPRGWFCAMSLEVKSDSRWLVLKERSKLHSAQRAIVDTSTAAHVLRVAYLPDSVFMSDISSARIYYEFGRILSSIVCGKKR
jgi:hypothetical protein